MWTNHVLPRGPAGEARPTHRAGGTCPLKLICIALYVLYVQSRAIVLVVAMFNLNPVDLCSNPIFASFTSKFFSPFQLSNIDSDIRIHPHNKLRQTHTINQT